MSSSADGAAVRWDGRSATELARLLALPRVELFASVTSTLDVANSIGPTARAGTLVLADEQTSGRGSKGRRWTSPPGVGIWLTLIERPSDVRALDVLALRCGLYAAESLEALAAAPIRVKWPNDLYVAGRKLAGVLIETRWRGTAPDWVAIGFGLNVAAPPVDSATGLADETARLDALVRLVPALRRAAAATHHLSLDELARWRERDVALDRPATAPALGRVAGVSSAGELLLARGDGSTSKHRTGTLTLAEPLPCS